MIATRRGFWKCGLLMLMGWQAMGQQAQSPEVTATTVVFVCEHGSAKSVIAAAHFNRLAAEKGLPYRAVSRGTNPDASIPASISSALAGDGLDVSTWRP